MECAGVLAAEATGVSVARYRSQKTILSQLAMMMDSEGQLTCGEERRRREGDRRRGDRVMAREEERGRESKKEKGG